MNEAMQYRQVGEHFYLLLTSSFVNDEVNYVVLVIQLSRGLEHNIT